ncbi:hypothetical protein ACFRMN_01860 [Streptomyces sp. NPDC056835]|uniref:hypothetical protein n=1 Tax=Streptomyces sp. NPDC056835 TaxID=3345956 RepID=UPI003692E5C9
MRKNGVDVADPEPGGVPQLPTGVPRSVLDKAKKECGEAPGSQARAGGGEFKDDPKFQELFLKNQKCLRENGWEMKKPKGDNIAVTPELNNPVLNKAKKACKPTGKALDDYVEGVMGQ